MNSFCSKKIHFIVQSTVFYGLFLILWVKKLHILSFINTHTHTHTYNHPCSLPWKQKDVGNISQPCLIEGTLAHAQIEMFHTSSPNMHTPSPMQEPVLHSHLILRIYSLIFLLPLSHVCLPIIPQFSPCLDHYECSLFPFHECQGNVG